MRTAAAMPGASSHYALDPGSCETRRSRGLNSALNMQRQPPSSRVAEAAATATHAHAHASHFSEIHLSVFAGGGENAILSGSSLDRGRGSTRHSALQGKRGLLRAVRTSSLLGPQQEPPTSSPPVTMATITRMSRTRVAQIAQSRAISTTAARAAAINFTPLVGKVANDADKVRLPPSPATGLAVFIFDELLKIPIHFLGWNSMSFQRSYNLVVSK